MLKPAPARMDRYRRQRWLLSAVLCAPLLTGCSILKQEEVPPLSGNGAVNRRTQLWQLSARQTSRRPASRPASTRPGGARPTGTRPAATGPAATRPATTGPASTQPAATRPSLPPLSTLGPTTTQPATSQPFEVLEPLDEPYQLNTANVIRITYHKSPLVVSSREDMIAARYGLEEFRANLSRFEPYVRADVSASEYPERRGSNGYAGELVGGIDRETFDGSVFRVEGGVNGSKYSFDRDGETPAEVESGTGGVLRVRLEVPFIGSRKRQDRTIKQAYQESTARQAMLEYLTDYRSSVSNSLMEYRQAILYLNQMRAYEDQIAAIEALLALPGLTIDERMSLQTAMGDAKVHHSTLQASHWTSLLTLLQQLGIRPGERYVLEEVKELPLRFLDAVRTPEGIQGLLVMAYRNNPRFTVLEDAIRNAELKRTQAILGTYDITAYFEGSHFPYGAPDFDDRVGGWMVTTGITMRLNDRRVLTASLKKAEAEIRAFRAQIQAEENDIRDQITIRADRLRAYYDSRTQVIENINRSRAQFEERCEAYFWRRATKMTIDDVLTALYLLTDAQTQLTTNMNQITDAENDLLVSTGEVYRLVGIQIEDRGRGMEVFEATATRPADPASQPAR